MITKLFSWHLWWNIVMLLEVSAYRNRPSNVVFIMVDDLGWNDVSFHGSDQIPTPNLDTLAYNGVILQQYYSEAICTPARSALLTGKYAMRIGMHGRPLSNSEDRGIPLTERLLPSYLKSLGYTTHLVGKWHVGMSRDEYLPTRRGYDTHYGMRGGFIDYYTYNKVEQLPSTGRSMSGLDLFDNDVPQVDEERYIVDALTDRAVRIINNHNQSSPLFLHLTHNAPHAGNAGGALQPPLYTNVKNRHIANSDRRLFAEVVTHLDSSVGRIVRALSSRGMLDDTIIVFVSDNGAPTVGEFANWGVNLPLRGRKETPWEGAVRVPAFIWHSSFRPRVWNGLMHISDWLPTLVEAAGGQVDRQIDGVNQWDSIVQDGDSLRKEVLIAVEDGSGNSYAAYRAGDYKIVVGNVTGIMNGYYGMEFLENRRSPPDYYSSLRSCEVSQTFRFLGKYIDVDTVQTMRSATALRQQDLEVDPTPCEPAPSRGCLYNIRRDPGERHNLWNQAGEIVTLMTSRLRGLWAQQTRRSPPILMPEADPINFGYNWMPWIESRLEDNRIAFGTNTKSQPAASNQIDRSAQRFNENKTLSNTLAGQINCNGPTTIRNFLCILRNVF